MTPLPYGAKMIIALRDCRFFAYHGVAEQEQRAGNEFKVSLEITYSPEKPIADNIENTISYAEIYEIVKEEMNKPRFLLETVLETIAETVCRRWLNISHLLVSITKISPPIPGIIGEAAVSLEYSR